MTKPVFLAPERPADAPLADALIARAFGPGRYAKAAERLRQANHAIAELSFLAWVDGRGVGCVRLWPITVGDVSALLLGPIAVDLDERSGGIGAALVRRACEAAKAVGHELVLLVGDEAYFGEFGFSAGPARGLRLPGPVDQNRVLVKGLVPGAADSLQGAVHGIPPALRPSDAAPRLALALVAS
jgi:predicted N-acetyltransferase YhbS